MIGSRRPLYLIVFLSTALVVALFMGAFTYHLYDTTKKRLYSNLERDSKMTLSSLQKSLAYFIEAYAVKEYELLVANEMQRRDFLAIIVEDANMAKILGEPFRSGTVRTGTDTLEEYAPDNLRHRNLLQQCYRSHTVDVTTTSGAAIGSVMLCSTDRHIREELELLLLQSSSIAVLIATMLILVLFVLLRRLVLTPLSNVAASISYCDSDGIPLNNVDEHGSRELEQLSKSINRMIDSVHTYREREQQTIQELEKERRRFALAVEGSQDGLWDWDTSTDTIFFSRQWKAMLGYEEEEIGDTFEEWHSRVHPDDIDGVMKAVQAHLRGETGVYESRHRLQCKDGSWKWILDRGKAEFDATGRAVRVVGFHTDITEEMHHQEALEHSAKHDSLTHLPNRFLFNELIQNAVYRAQRNGTKIAILYVDLDGFKEINDDYGHEVGDVVLVETGWRLSQLLRKEDILARLGGDEFIIAVSELAHNDAVVPLLKRIIQDINQPIFYQNDSIQTLQVSASIGVSFFPQKRDLGPDALLRQADQAMYEAKKLGKNRYRFFNLEADATMQEQLKQLDAFGRAIREDTLELYFQPKVEMRENRILGFEALLRWNHPKHGLLPPDAFLPYIGEERAIMLELGRWVFEHAFRQLAAWQAQGYDFTLSVNISSHEFNNDETLTLLAELLERYAINPSRLELEILETHALEDIRQAHTMIRKCQALGFSIALDDFGTGYSTLSYLKELPVDTLKIDKSFVIEMLYDSGSFSILEAAMGLAQAFRCRVVAEGVESEEHGIMLIQLGCTIGQGYAIARPMPADAVEPWIATWNAFNSWQTTAALPSRKLTVLIATVEHRQWIRMLEAHIDAPESLPLPELDSSKCRFGVWLKRDASRELSNANALASLRALHEEIHTRAKALEHSRDPAIMNDIRRIHQEILKHLEQNLPQFKDTLNSDAF